MTITRQQVDAWDAEVNAAYERGRQEGMKQERALWTLTKLGQEIEAQPVLCKYGNEVQGCTSSPMNCQCCFDSLDDLDEEPAQQPVEWLTGCPESGMDSGCDCDSGTYTPQQRQWVGLTDEEINICWHELMGRYDYSREMVYRAIEAKLKEKNT